MGGGVKNNQVMHSKFQGKVIFNLKSKPSQISRIKAESNIFSLAGTDKMDFLCPLSQKVTALGGCVQGEYGHKTGGKHGTQERVYPDQQDGAEKSQGEKIAGQ